MQQEKQADITAVLVHAAWVDGSSWNKVSTRLEAEGFRVVAAQIPLTSFSDDVASLKRLLRRQSGRVVLVGHSYGGAVITATAADDPNVDALVYIAAIVPDEGETVGEVFGREAADPKAPTLQPDEDGFLWLTVEAFRNAVAPDATREETSLMAANQKPIALKCLGEPMGRPAWKQKPSWFLIAENDRMVSPKTQRFLAERMRSTIVSLSSDHFPVLSAPEAVSKLIRDAAKSVAEDSSKKKSVLPGLVR
jgi:pimeloyl-ACP methyl ester carboxylesterase